MKVAFATEDLVRVDAPGALEIFQQCIWPGNVRELENCVERAATMMRGNLLREVDLRCQKGQCFSSVLIETTRSRSCYPIVGVPTARALDPMPADRSASYTEAAAATGSERDEIIAAMDRCGWVQAKAARLLGMTPRQIGYALRKYNVEVKRL